MHRRSRKVPGLAPRADAASQDDSTPATRRAEDLRRVRVAGPFTVESLSPHRIQAVDERVELIYGIASSRGTHTACAQEAENCYKAILGKLAKSGVHQQQKSDAIRSAA